ncbi:MAG: response regulator [Candidatus Latescibacteria bacterium]|nr:response regulator [Candidatus Latescibacterota bacterium]
MAELGRILIADDEETFLYSTADLLRKEGYQCDCAPDAVAAAERLRADEYDLLIADIKMPGNAELEFVRDVPQMAEGLPVILVTGYPSLGSAIESIQLPVAAYMVKPVEFDELLTQAQSAIEKFRVYHAVSAAQHRLRNYLEDLTDIEEALKTAPDSQSSSAPVDAFLELTFQNIVGSISDMKHLTQSIATHNHEGQEVCHLLQCPRLSELSDALSETVGVLEKTRHAFKSKDLGALRKKLEGIVRTGRNGGAMTDKG